MAIVVETGAGLSTAESYISLVEAEAYFTARAMAEAWTLGDVAAQEAALRRGTAFIDRHYRTRWPGVRTNGRAQALAWPRTEASDASGAVIATNEIPREVKHATAEAALRELAYPGFLTPDTIAVETVKRESFGSVSIEYDAPSQDNVIRVLDQILEDIIPPESEPPVLASAYYGFAVRA